MENKPNTKLSEELQSNIYCRIHFRFGIDIEECQDEILFENLKVIGNKYHLAVNSQKENRYCCSNYNIVDISGYLTLKETYNFCKEVDFPSMDLCYDEEQGFELLWDNTHY